MDDPFDIAPLEIGFWARPTLPKSTKRAHWFDRRRGDEIMSTCGKLFWRKHQRPISNNDALCLSCAKRVQRGATWATDRPSP